MKPILQSLKLSGALTLSIAAMPILVNAQSPVLTSVNKDKSSSVSKSHHAKDAKADVAKLIKLVLKSGADGIVASNLAPIIGLPKEMPAKAQEVVIKEGPKDVETRSCYVIYESSEIAAPEEKHAVCAYIIKFKSSGLDRQMRYFRIDLNGKLEKAVMTQSKFGTDGKVVRGSGVKFDQDIESPEVKKTFEAEMKYWLKDWLKKQPKPAAKKIAAPPAL